MSSLSLDILSARPQYQPILRQADAIEGQKSNNGLIDTDEEKLAAAKNVSEIAEAKFSGVSAEEADAYLRFVVGVVAPPHPAAAWAPITVGRRTLVLQSNGANTPAESRSVSRLGESLKRAAHNPGVNCPTCPGSRLLVGYYMATR
ncbi:MAG: hypothetical protein LBJ25_02605 [Candidatus Margulisbacteria bacterium]|nr:hypothetical protein [Candidatus Margulisiibacteriota bacterium]